MSDYKRLTKKSWHDTKFARLNQREVLYKLWQLENQIENGTLVELPCKVGDTVYYIDRYWKPARLKEYEVYGFFISKSGVYIEVGFGMCITTNQIFLTKAEAEAELAKIRREKQ